MENLHCTMMYHRGDCSDLQLQIDDVHNARGADWVLFFNEATGQNDVLVLSLSCPSVVARH